jgi:hypothetical protein
VQLEGEECLAGAVGIARAIRLTLGSSEQEVPQDLQTDIDRLAGLLGERLGNLRQGSGLCTFELRPVIGPMNANLGFEPDRERVFRELGISDAGRPTRGHQRSERRARHARPGLLGPKLEILGDDVGVQNLRAEKP